MIACNRREGEPRFFKAEGLTVAQRRQVVIHTRQELGTSERRTCQVVGVARSTLQYRPSPKDDDALHLALLRLAKTYGRYGYPSAGRRSRANDERRKIGELLQTEGWPPLSD